jgi:putative ATP-dependent endonuclease of OLD family
MKICSIGANNFRTLENFKLNLRPNYCAISGRNNAGKSAIVSIIQFFFDGRDDEPYFHLSRRGVSHSKDVTQWSSAEEMEISVELELDRTDDSEVFFVIETYSSHPIVENSVKVLLTQKMGKDSQSQILCLVNGQEVDGQKASEILKKFRSAANLVVHNSTNPMRSIYYLGGAYAEIMETYFSATDRKKIEEAENALQIRVKKAARQHKEELDKLLGKLNDKVQVELSSIERGRSSRFPLEIKLADKSVDVPLNDWGSGTQNRTRILISVLEAARMRSATVVDRSTPVFLVEEPESFLHPSAQAEFGQVLNGLAEELKIQIIATTHSPYMLNQSDPEANYLLERRIYRGLPKETNIKDTTGEDWMIPFAENLGIVPREFDSWKSVFAAHSSKVVLVEGDLDKKYFEQFRNKYPNIYAIPDGIDIVPYGGKDSLKNTSILQFMINKFGKVFITFDLDAKSEVESALKRINLKDGSDFSAIGLSTPGSDCIEGLLPESIKKKVYSDKHDLVTIMSSQDTKARKDAKGKLKMAFLEEFSKSSIDEKELAEFKKLFATISRAFQ